MNISKEQERLKQAAGIRLTASPLSRGFINDGYSHGARAVKVSAPHAAEQTFNGLSRDRSTIATLVKRKQSDSERQLQLHDTTNGSVRKTVPHIGNCSNITDRDTLMCTQRGSGEYGDRSYDKILVELSLKDGTPVGRATLMNDLFDGKKTNRLGLPMPLEETNQIRYHGATADGSQVLTIAKYSGPLGGYYDYIASIKPDGSLGWGKYFDRQKFTLLGLCALIKDRTLLACESTQVPDDGSRHLSAIFTVNTRSGQIHKAVDIPSDREPIFTNDGWLLPGHPERDEMSVYDTSGRQREVVKDSSITGYSQLLIKPEPGDSGSHKPDQLDASYDSMIIYNKAKDLAIIGTISVMVNSRGDIVAQSRGSDLEQGKNEIKASSGERYKMDLLRSVSQDGRTLFGVGKPGSSGITKAISHYSLVDTASGRVLFSDKTPTKEHELLNGIVYVSPPTTPGNTYEYTVLVPKEK